MVPKVSLGAGEEEELGVGAGEVVGAVAVAVVGALAGGTPQGSER